MTNPFIEELLERTADWRARFGQNILSVHLMGKDVTEDYYKKYLSALYGFIAGFENYIFPELKDLVPDLQERKKTSAIENDLQKLKVDTTSFEVLPEAYFRSMYPDAYAALGALYVLESSTLGGHLVQEHLKAALGEKTADKISYFVMHGDRSDAMWQRFLKNFAAIAENNDKKEIIIDGALRTYRLLDQLMTDESLK
ncbi:biliverdin-producing heme oxygenase [Sediminibacterium roseum]|uniref:Biliverdin-producing heme oxygenase n=1 Tax=Sediminibacterium roseum TaxID=1978412 RepID=A0ABW9ZP99_9BACT|nr:biliverdin-producing heme oxygenase [Sediminibacterium roseum]NCI48917.1 biliverdin-producing heme oxygenase [Sediminibacterium roseum]